MESDNCGDTEFVGTERMESDGNELPDTQAICSQQDQFQSGSTLQCGMWGRLFSIQENFGSCDLVKDEYAFGRSPACDEVYRSATVGDKMLPMLSKIHFRITRRLDQSTMTRVVELEDTSCNGTFVNGEPVGRDKKRILNNNDEISLAKFDCRVYIFINSNPSVRDGVSLPTSITDKYVVSRVLGSGTFGVVHLIFHKISKEKFAMKTSVKERVEASLDAFGKSKYNEGNVIESLNHPCIIQSFGEIQTPLTSHLILEYMEGGDLLKRILDVKKFAEMEAKFIFFQLTSAVKYLHSNGITHRDLKLDNILLKSASEGPHIKLADFGLSRVVGDSIMSTFCGTPQYLAPEVLKTGGRNGYTNKIDIWSLGVILFIFLSGKHPFNKDDKLLPMQQQILQGFYLFPKEEWKFISPAAIATIKRMMVVNPLKRLDIEQVCEEPWLKDHKVRVKISELFKQYSKRAMSDENAVPYKRLCTIDEAR